LTLLLSVQLSALPSVELWRAALGMALPSKKKIDLTKIVAGAMRECMGDLSGESEAAARPSSTTAAASTAGPQQDTTTATAEEQGAGDGNTGERGGTVRGRGRGSQGGGRRSGRRSGRRGGRRGGGRAARDDDGDIDVARDDGDDDDGDDACDNAYKDPDEDKHENGDGEDGDDTPLVFRKPAAAKAKLAPRQKTGGAQPREKAPQPKQSETSGPPPPKAAKKASGPPPPKAAKKPSGRKLAVKSEPHQKSAPPMSAKAKRKAAAAAAEDIPPPKSQLQPALLAQARQIVREENTNQSTKRTITKSLADSQPPAKSPKLERKVETKTQKSEASQKTSHGKSTAPAVTQEEDEDADWVKALPGYTTEKLNADEDWGEEEGEEEVPKTVDVTLADTDATAQEDGGQQWAREANGEQRAREANVAGVGETKTNNGALTSLQPITASGTPNISSIRFDYCYLASHTLHYNQATSLHKLIRSSTGARRTSGRLG